MRISKEGKIAIGVFFIWFLLIVVGVILKYVGLLP